MRIWSLHPEYLDSKGLVALWRETLLAKHVLEEKTKGYKNHPQLNRFKKLRSPLKAINFYLECVFEEAKKRNYNFDEHKFERTKIRFLIPVTKGQIEYEAKHLLAKLKVRDPKKFSELKKVKKIKPHPLLNVVKGDIEEWEIV